MSFPNRTAFYDREKDVIKSQKDLWTVVVHDDMGVVETNTYGEWQSLDRYIPLTYTGLHDQDDNEIFEGHIVYNPLKGDSYDGDNNGIIVFHYGSFVWRSFDDFRNETIEDGFKGYSISTYDDTWEDYKIIGHALTESDLIPESFNVEEYFYDN